MGKLPNCKIQDFSDSKISYDKTLFYCPNNKASCLKEHTILIFK